LAENFSYTSEHKSELCTTTLITKDLFVLSSLTVLSVMAPTAHSVMGIVCSCTCAS